MTKKLILALFLSCLLSASAQDFSKIFHGSYTAPVKISLGLFNSSTYQCTLTPNWNDMTINFEAVSNSEDKEKWPDIQTTYLDINDEDKGILAIADIDTAVGVIHSRVELIKEDGQIKIRLDTRDIAAILGKNNDSNIQSFPAVKK